MRVQQTTVAAIIAALGLAIAGLFVGVGFERGRSADRYVTVKGVAERDVTSDLAIWPLRVVAADNDLTVAHARLESSVQKIMQFLAARQIDTTGAALANFEVSDAFTNQYGGGNNAPTRYVIRQTVVVRSNDPEKILAASQHVAELVSSGVVLSSGGEYGAGGPNFVFTGLNKLKPAMIGEATARARSRGTVRSRFEELARRNHDREPGCVRDLAAGPGAGDHAREPGREDDTRGVDRQLFPEGLSWPGNRVSGRSRDCAHCAVRFNADWNCMTYTAARPD